MGYWWWEEKLKVYYGEQFHKRRSRDWSLFAGKPIKGKHCCCVYFCQQLTAFYDNM